MHRDSIHRRRRRWRVLLSALALSAASAACSNGGGNTAPTAPQVLLPEEETAVVIDVDAQLWVTAGGEVYRPAGGVESEGVGRGSTGTTDGAGGWRAPLYAPPPPPPPSALEVAQLTDAGLTQVLARLGELGLAGQPPEYGDVGITDQGTFVMTVTTADDRYLHAVYARGEETGDDDADEARRRLDEFVTFLDGVETELGDDVGPFSPYVPELWSIEVETRFSSRGATEPWPFSEEPVAGCTEFAADDVTSGGTDDATGLYEIAGDRLVAVDPLLPGAACPS